jgi:hypothetical protein
VTKRTSNTSTNPWWIGGITAVLVVLVVLVVVAVAVLPGVLLEGDLGKTTARLKPAELAQARNDIRGTLLQAIGGLLLLAGAVTAFLQLKLGREQMLSAQDAQAEELELSRSAHLAETFTRAVEHLADDKPDIRIGACLALGHIATDPMWQMDAVNLLCSWIRHQQPSEPTHQSPYAAESSLRWRAPDLQVALDVVSTIELDENRYLQLYMADLRPAMLYERDLRRADLRLVKLQNADLRRANLSGAHLEGANLVGAILLGTDMTGAFLEEAVVGAVQWDADTKWPEGFTPPLHPPGGVTVVDRMSPNG